VSRGGNGEVCITDLKFLDAGSRQPLQSIVSGQDVVAEIAYQSQAPSSETLDNVSVEMVFFNAAGQFVTVLHSTLANGMLQKLPSNGKIYCHVCRFPLMRGSFRVSTRFEVNGVTTDYLENAATMIVEPADYYESGYPLDGGQQGVYINQIWTAESDQ
jgi:hypothetical protein